MISKRVVSKYELGEIIGKGAYSEVHKALNTEDKRTYAVKVISNRLLVENAKLKECICNEMATHSSIGKWANIVEFKELLQTKNNCYFVYEYCQGGTLHEYIVKHRFLQEQQALQIFHQLLNAFRILHKHHIMHRDIKPENILIHQNTFKIADFGFCKDLTQANMAATMLGSPLYMAPEVLRGQQYSSNADIWSLGVILYEMLYGHCPFQSNSIANLINNIEETKLHFPEQGIQVSLMTKDIIRKSLQKDPKLRITWEQLFKANKIHLTPHNLNNTSEVFDSKSQIFCSKSRAELSQIKNYSQISPSPSTEGKSINRYARSVKLMKTANSQLNNQEFYQLENNHQLPHPDLQNYPKYACEQSFLTNSNPAASLKHSPTKFQIFKLNYFKNNELSNVHLRHDQKGTSCSNFNKNSLNVNAKVGCVVNEENGIKDEICKLKVCEISEGKVEGERLMEERKRNRSVTCEIEVDKQPSLLKNSSSIEEYSSKHQRYCYILNFILKELELRDRNTLKYVKPLLSKVNQGLKRIYSQINVSDTHMLSILSLIKYEVIQIEKMQCFIQAVLEKMQIQVCWQVNESDQLSEELKRFWRSE